MNRYNMSVSSMRVALLRPAAKKELTGMADWRTILTDRQTDRQTDKIRLSFWTTCLQHSYPAHRGNGLIMPCGSSAFFA